jgi:hypothetical protein
MLLLTDKIGIDSCKKVERKEKETFGEVYGNVLVKFVLNDEENKRRKQEAASIIKKLSYVIMFLWFDIFSERKIDTSSLQSTKSIGQFGRTGARPSRIHRPPSPVEPKVTSDSSESEVENDVVDTRNRGGVSELLEAPRETGPTVVGGALKSNGFPVSRRKAKKVSTGQTWRERIQGAITSQADEPDAFDDSEPSESDEYSEWGGLSDDQPEENEVNGPADGEELPDSAEEELSGSRDDENGDESSEVNDGLDTARNTHERAKQFTDWARQQSGLGGTAPNLSTFTQIPEGLQKSRKPVPSKPTLPLDAQKKKVLEHAAEVTNESPFTFT